MYTYQCEELYLKQQKEQQKSIDALRVQVEQIRAMLTERKILIKEYIICTQ